MSPGEAKGRRGRRPPPARQRVAARLLLACCTLALGLGLGGAIAVRGVLDLQHPGLRVGSPGRAEGRLDRGVHDLFVVRTASGDGPTLSRSGPSCAVTDLAGGRPAPAAGTTAGFAAVRVEEGGRHRVTCTSDLPLTVDVAHRGEGAAAYLAAFGRGFVPALLLTVLAAVLAARALVAVRGLRAEPT